MPGLDELLGLGAPGGSVFNIVQSDGSPVPQQQAPQQAPQAPQFQRPHGIRNLLGIIGDALLVSHGQAPAYQNKLNEMQQNTALQGFLTNPDEAVQRLMQVDPRAGIALYSQIHPKSEVPQGVKEYEYYHGLPDEQRAGFEKFLQLTHPGMMAPVTLGENDHVEQLPTSGPPQSAIEHLKAHPELAPQFDQKYGSGSSSKVLGGATASTPSPTFR